MDQQSCQVTRGERKSLKRVSDQRIEVGRQVARTIIGIPLIVHEILCVSGVVTTPKAAPVAIDPDEVINFLLPFFFMEDAGSDVQVLEGEVY